MKKTLVGVGVVALFMTNSATLFAAQDITPTVRSQSEITTQITALYAQLEKVRALLAAAVITSESEFTVSIDDVVVLQKSTVGMTKDVAQAQCEAVAYDTDNMWKLVTCTFAGQTLYRNVFIAG